ncbi:MAG: PorT family protein [Dysgonamonadaceae bacterium]|jgi:hypothetical protein|nr:PorT family protein [Dysgonamonadaceae bacterium]
MKKILFTIILYIIFSNIVLSQDMRYGVAIGWENSNYSTNYPINYKAGDLDFRSRPGFKIAFLLECPINDNIFIVPEFVFTQRGVKQDWLRDDLEIRDSIFNENKELVKTKITHVEKRKGKSVENINYLQLPVNIMYKTQITSDVKFSIFLGAYIGYALSGNVTSDVIDYNVTSDVIDYDVASGVIDNNKEEPITKFPWSQTETIKFGSGEKEYKKFDMGLNVGIGLEYADFFLNLQYNMGLINKLNYEYYSRNNNIGISLGYLF